MLETTIEGLLYALSSAIFTPKASFIMSPRIEVCAVDLMGAERDHIMGALHLYAVVQRVCQVSIPANCYKIRNHVYSKKFT